MFRRIVAENFLSWARLEFDFKSGVTLIEGFNYDDGSSEGSGKSAIPNALCWGLYGQVPKDVNIDEVIREGEDSCTVTVYTNDGLEIVRKRGPNELYIVDTDGQRIKGKDVKETQKKIQDLIGMSFDTFCQSVYFAQNYTRKFITATEEDKAKIFSELQDLSWCDKAAKKSNDLLKEAKTTISALEVKLGKLEGSIHVYQQNIKDYERLNAQFESDKEKELQAAFLRIKSDEDGIKRYKEALDQLGVGTSSVQAQKEAIRQLQSELAREQAVIDKYLLIKAQHQKALHSKNCPTCGQSMPEVPNLPPLPLEPTESYVAIKTLKAQIVEGLKSEELENQKGLQRKEMQFKINILEASVKTQTEAIQKIETKVNVYGTQIEQVRSNLTVIEADIAKINDKVNSEYEKINQLEILKSGFKELKSHVFQSLLSDLNSKANRYVQELFDVPASIEFSNISADGEISKITTMVTLDGVPRSIGLLSGGQFRRVQIAVDFALSEIVSDRAGKAMGIRILDEPFKDLSEVKMEKVIALLEHMKGSTVIIEHNSMVRTIVNQVFKVELRDGVSTQV